MSKILVDIDGVMCDLVGEVLNRLNKRLGTKFKQDKIKEWNFFAPESVIFTEEEMRHINEIMKEEGLTNECSLITDAKETLEKLKEQGHEIIWLTAPWKHSKTWCYDRTLWIERELGHISKNTIFAWNKEDIPGDVLIDDNPEFIMKWQNKHSSKGLAYLFRQPWNVEKGEKEELVFLDGWKDMLFILDET